MESNLGSDDYRNDKRDTAPQTQHHPIGIWACESFVLYAQENWMLTKAPGVIPFSSHQSSDCRAVVEADRVSLSGDSINVCQFIKLDGRGERDCRDMR